MQKSLLRCLLGILICAPQTLSARASKCCTALAGSSRARERARPCNLSIPFINSAELAPVSLSPSLPPPSHTHRPHITRCTNLMSPNTLFFYNYYYYFFKGFI